MDVSFAGTPILVGYDLVAGTNTLNIAGFLGSTVTLPLLQSYATSGNIILDVAIQDASNPANDYQLVMSVFDIVKPTLSVVAFDGVLATNTLNLWSFDTTGLNDATLAAMNVTYNVSEDSTLTLTDYGTDVVLTKGVNVIDLTTIVGQVVTNQLLNDNAIAGVFLVNAELADESGNITRYQFQFNLDVTAPVVTMTSSPVVVNDVKKVVEVAFMGNEEIKISGGTNIVFTQGSLTYTGVAVQASPTVIAVTIPADTFVAGVTPIDVTATFVDVALNETLFASQITVDSEAPFAVTNLTSTIDANGHVTLSWVNPGVGTYSTLRIVREGDFTVSLDPTATTFTDLTTERGQSYTYVVVVGDEAGNETGTTPMLVSIPAAVVATTLSDTYVYAPVAENLVEEDVKAQITEEDTDLTDEEDNDEGLPFWGVLLLVFLAAVGAYLIWNQKPAPVVAPVATKKKNTSNKKK
jgi:hypothetical protein